jgi:hypothetical protein
MKKIFTLKKIIIATSLILILLIVSFKIWEMYEADLRWKKASNYDPIAEENANAEAIKAEALKHKAEREVIINKVLSENKPPLFPDKIQSLYEIEWLEQLDKPEERVMYEIGTGYTWLKNENVVWAELETPKDLKSAYKYQPAIDNINYFNDSISLSTYVDKTSDINNQKYRTLSRILESSNILIPISYSKEFNIIIFGNSNHIYFGNLAEFSTPEIVKFNSNILSTYTNPVFTYYDKLTFQTIDYYFDKGIGVIKNPDGSISSSYLIFKPMSKEEVVEKDWEYFSVDFMRKEFGCNPSMCGYDENIQVKEHIFYKIHAPNKEEYDKQYAKFLELNPKFAK